VFPVALTNGYNGQKFLLAEIGQLANRRS